MKKYTLIVVIGIMAALGIFFLSRQKSHEVLEESPVSVSYVNASSDLIQPDLRPGDAIENPLVLSGKARGYWYFEASFPALLVDESGAVLAEVPVQAQEEWMTEDFVSFLATIPYPPQPIGSRGTLILRNDNPSGEPEFDRSVAIPVRF